MVLNQINLYSSTLFVIQSHNSFCKFSLQNTDFIEGIVVYAGHETKAMLNNSGPRYKRSQLEQQMNYDVIW